MYHCYGKTSEIVPVPKKKFPKTKNDRPVALTCIPMKYLERIVKTHLVSETKGYMDKYQIAYTENRSVDNATLTLLHKLYSHLDKNKALC